RLQKLTYPVPAAIRRWTTVATVLTAMPASARASARRWRVGLAGIGRGILEVERGPRTTSIEGRKDARDGGLPAAGGTCVAGRAGQNWIVRRRLVSERPAFSPATPQVSKIGVLCPRGVKK